MLLTPAPADRAGYVQHYARNMRVLRGPGVADRVMAAQLLGTGGIAALLLLDAATGVPGVADAALTLALLAAFATVALVRGAPDDGGEPPA